MQLSQADSFFNNVSVEGWDGVAWVPTGLKGNLHSYDRFLGPRTFGQKQRLLLFGGDVTIPPNFEYIRVPNNKQYLLLSYNQDIINDKVHTSIYVMQEAESVVKVIRLTQIPAPSGIGGTTVEVVDSTEFCDFERYSGETARGIDGVSYIQYSFILAKSVPITIDSILRTGGLDYEVREINPLLSVHEIRAVKRG